MMNRVRNAHAWAALLLLAAACDGGGGGGDDDKDSGSRDGSVIEDADVDGETPEDDGSVEEDGSVEGDGGEDAGLDGGGETDGLTMMTMDADTDTGTTGDTGTGGDDAATDAGTDSGPTIPANCAETTIVAATGGSVTATDNHFTLTLAGGQLSADSTVRVCVVAAASAPSSLDGRVGDAYEITTTGGATFAASTATFRGHSALPGVDATAAFNAVTVRALPAGGSVGNGTGAVLRLSKRAATADTVTTLSATVSGPGHVYAAPLDAYQVDMHTPKTTYLVGEVIDISTVITVGASPAVATRTIEVEVNGCDLEPINYAALNHTVPQTTPANPNCSGRYSVASRTLATHIEGGITLSAGRSIDLRDADSTPTSLFCKFPGTGKGATRLLFKTGTTTDLEVTKDVEVTCAYSGDMIAYYDEVPITRGGGTDFVVGSTYTPRAFAAIAPPGTFTALAPDAVTFTEPAAVLSGSGAAATFDGDADYLTGPDLTPTTNPTNSAAFSYSTDRYNASFTNGTGFFRFLPRAQLHFFVGGQLAFDCYPPSSGDISLQLSDRSGASSTVSILDGSIDLIWIRVRVPGTGSNTIVQRLIDATKLGRYQSVPLLTPAQQGAITGTPSEYAVGFYRVVWDEKRTIWQNGRIVPVVCGTTLLFEAADVAP